MLRVGLLGAGRIERVHARSITAHPRSALAALSDVNRDAAADLAGATGARAATTEDILANGQIDAVLAATSTDTHADLIEATAAANKAVLCEKPVDLDLARVLRCREAVASAARPVMIGFNRRFDPNFARLKRAVDAGEIGTGELLSLTCFDPRRRRWPISGCRAACSATWRSTKEWDAFVSAALDGTPVPVTLQDGINALATAEAATETAQTGASVALDRRIA